MINAITTVFPGAVIKGCFFHLTKAHWRKVQRLGLVPDYEDPEFALLVKAFTALAFVPVNDVRNSFRAIVDNPNFDPRLAEYASYIEVFKYQIPKIPYSFNFANVLIFYQSRHLDWTPWSRSQI